MHAASASAAAAVLLAAAPAGAAVISHSDEASFLAAAGTVETFDFTGQPAGTPVGGTHAGQGMVFSGAEFADDAAFSDGEGVIGAAGAAIEVVFDRLIHAIGFDYLGALTIVLYDSFAEIGRSDDFGGPGGSGFGGVTSDEGVKRVILLPWRSEAAAMLDNMRRSTGAPIDPPISADIPLPPAAALLAAGLAALGAVRRRG
ncbi:hypothetical protein ACQ5SO_03600 [Rhodovulum sp. DZ06]|uniref:hypothetical protein n=1 Tax=Rhodovulum sp. DZ06 TaxID=3425126 RepID=UPI003D33542F